MDSVLLVTFEKSSDARQMMTELHRLDAEGALAVCTAAVLERQPDGRFRVWETTDNIGFTATASGGLIGALLGAVAGPAGLLLGGATGAAVGAVSDADGAGNSELLLTMVGSRVPRGATAVVAEAAAEPAPEIVNAVVARLGGKLTRRSRPDVESELAVAADAVRAAEEEAEAGDARAPRGSAEDTLGDRAADVKDKRKDNVTGG